MQQADNPKSRALIEAGKKKIAGTSKPASSKSTVTNSGNINVQSGSIPTTSGETRYKYTLDDKHVEKWLNKGASNTKNFDRNEAKKALTNDSSNYRGIYHSAGLYTRDEIDYYRKRYRFGLFDPYNQLHGCKEYLFFTCPDLNIYPRNNTNGTVSDKMQEVLRNSPYWRELEKKHPHVLMELQSSRKFKNVKYDSDRNYFNHLLGNCVRSSLDVPSLSADMVETASTVYGVNVQYHGSSEASNDNFDFSLEFRDNKSLDVYNFFKAYEEYQVLRHHGVLDVYQPYAVNKILYDQYSIYKFLVDEDGETILYYAKYYGVTSKNLPRDVFSNTSFDGGISYNIDFHAFGIKENEPEVLAQFNRLSMGYYKTRKFNVPIFNTDAGRIDNRAVKAAAVFKERNTKFGNADGYVYKLLWKGDDKE